MGAQPKCTYFLSDIHLDAARPDTSRAFSKFLHQIAGCDALYILGDLFETWIGDDDDSELAEQTRHALKTFTDSGSDGFLMLGNRDFLLGQQFAQECGATLLPEPSVLELDGETTLLMHGDSLCTADIDYQAFRQTVRDRSWQEEVLAQPMAQRRELAHSLREASREATAGKAASIVDVSLDAVEAAMRAHGAGHLIHGHTHRPGQHQHPWGQRWVLGDWQSSPIGLKVSPQGWSLFNIF